MNLEPLKKETALIPLSEMRALERACNDARRQIIFEIPDPEEFAFTMTTGQVALLRAASPSRNGWVVNRHSALHLRVLGLVECGHAGRYLTAFGMAVLAIILRDEA